MSNLKPVLCNTESDIDAILTESSIDTRTNQCHTSTTYKECTNDTINKLISKLDITEEDTTNTSSESSINCSDSNIKYTANDDDGEYITKSKFSALIGEMRVDILSMINLLSVLNKNSTILNEEIKQIKRDLYDVIDENRELKEKINENNINITSIEPVKVIKKIQTKDEKPFNQINSIVDSHMDKNISKVKVVQNSRKKNNNVDSFGTIQKSDEQPITNRRTAFKEIPETKVPEITDTKTSRANRLGLKLTNL